MPQMQIRNADSLNSDLGLNSLPNGFVSLPIYTFVNPTTEDDISYDGCPFAIETTDLRYPDNGLYIDYWWIADFSRDPLAKALGVDQQVMDDADFLGCYHYQDAYVAREFEGLPMHSDDAFTPNSYYEMRTLQKIELVNMFDRESRMLTFSRLMRKPIAEMQNRVDNLLGLDSGKESKLRYAIYSAHDDQISNMMEWMHPNNVALDYIIYASQIVFELTYNTGCLAQETPSEDCFNVAVINNGKHLGFDLCADSAKSDGTGCSFKDFKKQFESIWYDGVNKDNLDEACF